MSTLTQHRRILLSTATLLGALSGYGRGAYAACTVTTAPNVECSGANVIQQSIPGNNAVVSTVPGFSVVTGDANAIRMSGDGGLFFVDTNSSTVTGGTTGLSATGVGDVGLDQGAITIDTNGTITGGNSGIDARLSAGGSGAVDVTVNGTVTGTAAVGVNVGNFAAGSDVTVTTGVNSDITGATFGVRAGGNGTGLVTITSNGAIEATGAFANAIYGRASGGTGINVTTAVGSVTTSGGPGIRVRNFVSGNATVIANGNVTATNDVGTGNAGILAENEGVNLSITTGASATILGGDRGIRAMNDGSGTLEVTTNGNVTGTDLDGIDAINSGTDSTVTTAAGTTVTGGNNGIQSISSGTGTVRVTANSNVTGTNRDGIVARNAGTDLLVTTGVNTMVMGGSSGISANTTGSGIIDIRANGHVSGTSTDGIAGTGTGTDISIATGVGTTVEGGNRGVAVRNYGTGAATVTANGDVTGMIADGIHMRLGTSALPTGTDITVTTGVGTTVVGAARGISAFSYGSGTVRVTANGDVTGTNTTGIDATNAGTDLFVTTGVGSEISGGISGIRGLNRGSGETTIIANGNVTGTSGVGIAAENEATGTNVAVTTGANTTVTGLNFGVRAIGEGTGTTTVTANGNVTATAVASRAIYADNTANGADLIVNTGVGSMVGGGRIGIDARNHGRGELNITANGNVTGGTEDGIFAENEGTNLNVTAGVGSTVLGDERGIAAVNTGTGAVDVTANGNVTGTNEEGILATNGATGTDINVTTAAGTAVTGGTFGVQVLNSGTGAVDVTANGNVTGIMARNAGNGATDVTTAASATIIGNIHGIQAESTGAGTLTVTTNGDVTGTTGVGVYAQSAGGDLAINTISGATIRGRTTGVFARQTGAGAVDIDTDANIIGDGGDGIYAAHQLGGPINITVVADNAVTSNGVGVDDFAIETYAGPTNLVVAGTLNGGAGGAVAFDQINAVDDRMELHTTAVVNGTVFAGGGTDTLAFAGTGNGTFDLAGIDTGANTQQYRDFETFIVESAIWNLNGVTSADFIVNGGTVTGNGTFGDLTVNRGTLSPGNAAFGTVTVNGVFSLNAGAIFEVEVNPNNMGDVVVVNGTVNLTGATLRILAENGEYELETDYVIIDNDGTDAVNGIFGRVTSNLAFLIATVSYVGGTGNDVVLTLTRNQVDPCDVATTQNQSAACSGIDENNPLFPSILGLTVAGARQAFDALSGEIHATLAGVLIDDNRYVREAILGRLKQANHTDDGGQVSALGAAGPQVASLNSSAMALGYGGKSLGGKSLGGKSLAPPPRSPIAFWTAAYGAWGVYNGDGNAATAKRDLGGFMSGMDASIGGSWRVGLTTGASHSSIDVDKRHSSADIDSYYLGGYAGGMIGAFSLRGGGTWAWNDIDTSRAVIFPGFFERQKASYDADTSQIFGEVIYPTSMGGVSLEPFAGLAYVTVDGDRFLEHGGALASLRGRGADQNVGYTTLGLRAATTTQWGSTVVTPHLSARWQHAFDDVIPSAGLAFATGGAGFNVVGVPLAEDSALIDAGFDFALGENATAGLAYSGQFGDGVHDNAVKGRFTWLF